MSGVACRAASPWVTALGTGEHVSFGPAVDHIGRCLRCQARVARTRRMHRDLRSMAHRQVRAPDPAGARLGDGDVLRERRPFVIMGLVAVLAAGAVGARRMLAH